MHTITRSHVHTTCTRSVPFTDFIWLRPLPPTADHPRQEVLKYLAPHRLEPELSLPESDALLIELWNSVVFIRVHTLVKIMCKIIGKIGLRAQIHSRRFQEPTVKANCLKYSKTCRDRSDYRILMVSLAPHRWAMCR